MFISSRKKRMTTHITVNEKALRDNNPIPHPTPNTYPKIPSQIPTPHTPSPLNPKLCIIKLKNPIPFLFCTGPECSKCIVIAMLPFLNMEEVSYILKARG